MWIVGIDVIRNGINISKIFIILTVIIIPLSIMISNETSKKYYLIILIILLGLFNTQNILTFYILFESILIPVIMIIGIYGSRRRKNKAVNYIILLTLIGSLITLISILMIWNITGTLEKPSIQLTKESEKILFIMMFISFAIKTPIIPFHIWLPEAHTEARTGGSIILAGILLKMGSYGLIKFCVELMPYGSNYYRPIIYLISIISIIYSSLGTIRQIDLKRIIAYSSIGHMGIINIGIFSNTLIGIAGSIILIIAHGLTSSGLFICIGSLYSKYHTRSIMYFKGLTSIMPILSTLFFILLLGNMGTPLTSNYIGELMCYIGGLKGETNWSIQWTIIASLSIILSACYNIWLYIRITGGTVSKSICKSSDLNRNEVYILLFLATLNTIIGIYPNIILNGLEIEIRYLIY